MAFQKDTIRVSNTAFAPVGAEVEWQVRGLEGIASITTFITDKNEATGEIELCYDSTCLPGGFGGLTESMISSPKVVECNGLPKLARLPLILSGGTGPGDVSGGAVERRLGDNIHIWSDTLTVTVEKDGTIRIENSDPYTDPVDVGDNNDTDFNPCLVLPRL